MPFAVFRRYQKKLIAALALFAMVAFTLDFSLLRFGGTPGDEYLTVSEQSDEPIRIFDQKLRQSDLSFMMAERARANRFMTLLGAPTQYFFGGLDTRSIVDAKILERKANELGIPADKQLAVNWLRGLDLDPTTAGIQGLSTQDFDALYRRGFSQEVTDVQLLEDLANQLRIAQVRGLPGVPPVTPLDVYLAYRDQNMRVAAKLVPFRVEQYLEGVPTPTDAEVQAYFEKYRDVEPDPGRESPGFKIPQRIVVEYVMADVPRLADEIKAGITEEELRAFFRETQSNEDTTDDFFISPTELPLDVFAGEPELPTTRDEFPEVRDQVADRLARQRAEDEVARRFDAVEEAVGGFVDEYFLARDSAEQAGGKASVELPVPGDLMKSVAEEVGLDYEKTPPLDAETAANYGRIGSARLGGSAFDPGTLFAVEFFSPDRRIHETVPLSDALGREYLAWKLQDEPARVPELSEVRDQVVMAWKLEKARAEADKAANAFASEVRAAGGDLVAVAEQQGKAVVTTLPTPRMMPGLPDPMNPFQSTPPRPSEIPQVPDAGEDFRAKYFKLDANSVEVASNAPRSVFYVMARDAVQPVTLTNLYGRFGPRVGIESEVLSDAVSRRSTEWLEQLRSEAGLDPNWVPPEDRATRGRRS